jgi:hypothetical protein
MIARLHVEGTLSEGQCCKELNLGRVEFRAMVDRERVAERVAEYGENDDG